MAFFQEYRKELKKVKEQLNDTAETKEEAEPLNTDSHNLSDIVNDKIPSEVEFQQVSESSTLWSQVQENDPSDTDLPDTDLSDTDSVYEEDLYTSETEIQDEEFVPMVAQTEENTESIMSVAGKVTKELRTDSQNTAKYRDDCSYISKGTTIMGSITTTDDVIVEGTVWGGITGEKHVEIAGTLKGDASASSVLVSGKRFEGTLRCTGSAVIKASCVMIGDITAETLRLEGAVKGNVSIQKEAVITSSAVLKGDLHAASLQQDYGALAEGRFTIGQNPVIE